MSCFYLHRRHLSPTSLWRASSICARQASAICNGAASTTGNSPDVVPTNPSRSNVSSSALLVTVTKPTKVLVTGALGQVGEELVPYLRSAYGNENVIASDVKTSSTPHITNDVVSDGPFRRIDVLNPVDLSDAVAEEGITTIVHLAAILSANGELNPQLALHINNEGTQNVLEVARREGDVKVFCPSTIAVFGPTSPKHNTPDDCIMRPTTMYGITKVFSELLGEYYHNSFGVDFRSLRYPGVISTKQMPGGGTTDYAVEIFLDAVKRGRYSCYLKKDAALPFIYMPDLLKGTLQLLEADEAKLTRRTYNLGAMSFSPEQLARCIGQYMEDFAIDYKPDFRQDIADTWPRDIDFTAAMKDWGWKPDYGIENMTREVLEQFLQQQQAEDAAENDAMSRGCFEPILLY